MQAVFKGLVIAMLWLLVGCYDGVRELRIDSPQGHWQRQGYALMVAPLQLPQGAHGHSRISIWLRISNGTVLTVHQEKGMQRPTLSYSKEVEAVRVEELHQEDGRWHTVDVRGTRLLAKAQEQFFMLRPEGLGPDASMVGYAWPRGSTQASSRVNHRLARWLLGVPQPGISAAAMPGFSERLQRLNRCEACHIHNKAQSQRVIGSADGITVPRRPTDAAGFYEIQSVLTDVALLAAHRDWDVNDSPFVQVRCGGAQARRVLTDTERFWQCDNGHAPVGRFDMPQALAANDAHAQRVCESRRYLHEFMNLEAQQAFAKSLGDCSLEIDLQRR